MAVSKKQRTAIEHRRRQVAELFLKGYSQTAIGNQLDVTQATICNDLKKIHEIWRASTIRDFDLAAAAALLRLDLIECEAWEAWERSKKPAQSAVILGEGVSQPTRKTLRNQNGDPRYLTVVLRCEEARRALLALDPPKRTEPADTEGQPLTLPGLLKEIGKNPPPMPTSFDPHPPNVIDVDAICRLIEEMPPEPGGGEKQSG
ncbi:MAG TPA: hypothetical protein VGN42_21315 [Pirellulales bacterium]|jgi:hypothetical protein|nr:hypothetical protein [Pirellulales bacterium]